MGLVVSVVSLYLALRSLTLQEIWVVLSQANGRTVSLALASVALGNLAKTARWRVLLGQRGAKIGFGKLLMSQLVGQMFNLLYPARIGDLSRAYVIGGLGAGRVFVLGTVVVEKILDMLSYALLFLVLIILIPLPFWVNDSGYTFVIVTLVVLLMVFFATWQREWIVRTGEWLITHLPGWLQTLAVGRVGSALASLDTLQNRVEVLKLAFWSAIIWSTAVLNNQLVLLSFGIHLPLTAALLVLIGLQVGISIPSIPGRVGIFEYICVLALSLFNVKQGAAFSYGVLLHGIVLLTPTLAGLFSFGILTAPGVRARQPEENIII